MNAPTKEQLDAVSNLLQACRLCGAKFATGKKTVITMPDSRIYRVDELVHCWRFSHKGFRRIAHKSASPEQIKNLIYELHVTITNSSCGSPALG